MSKILLVVLFLAASVAVGCNSPRNDGFDWGNRQLLDCVAGKC